jgi:hypothetical protein
MIKFRVTICYSTFIDLSKDETPSLNRRNQGKHKQSRKT